MEYESVIKEFHVMWDGFPGLARLIRSDHVILASNEIAKENGFVEGECCARIGSPETHRNCLLNKMMQTGESQTQRFGEKKIKGWSTVSGHPDLCVHFTIVIP